LLTDDPVIGQQSSSPRTLANAVLAALGT